MTVLNVGGLPLVNARAVMHLPRTICWQAEGQASCGQPHALLLRTDTIRRWDSAGPHWDKPAPSQNQLHRGCQSVMQLDLQIVNCLLPKS